MCGKCGCEGCFHNRPSNEEIVIDNIINNKINEYINKYKKYPKYLKIPLWIYSNMIHKIKYIDCIKINYEKGGLTYRNLIVCETITIEKAEEIEVF